MDAGELLCLADWASLPCFDEIFILGFFGFSIPWKKFPYTVDCLVGEEELSVLVDRGIHHRSLVAVLRDMSSGREMVRNITRRQNRANFQGLIRGRRYRLQVKMGDMLRRCAFESYCSEIVFGGQQVLRVQGVGSGRCGTQSMAFYLDGLTFRDGTPVRARHETAAMTILNHLLAGNRQAVVEITRSYLHNAEVAPYFWFVPESITANRVVLIVRDGRRVVSSGMARGWFQRHSIRDQIKPDYPGSYFEKCCHLWAESCAVLKPLAHVTVRLEDLPRSEEARRSLLDALDIKWSDKPFPVKNVSRVPVTLQWSREEKEIFEQICGRWMDEYYPDWRTGD